MNRRFSGLVLAAVVVVSLGGCRSLLKKRDSAESAAPIATAPPVATVAPAPAVAAPAATVAVDEGAIPASQDYEDEAFAKVTAGTYKAEFARLKQEIEAK
jgi:hypothetical protein